MTSADQRAQGLLSTHLSQGELDDWERCRRILVPSSYVAGVILEIEACDSYVILLEGTVPTKARIRVRWPLDAPPGTNSQGAWWIDLVDRVPGTVGQRRALRAFVHPGVVFDLCLWYVGPPMPQADEVLGYRVGLDGHEESLWRRDSPTGSGSQQSYLSTCLPNCNPRSPRSDRSMCRTGGSSNGRWVETRASIGKAGAKLAGSPPRRSRTSPHTA